MMIKRLFLALLIASAGAFSAVALAACEDEDGDVLPDDAQEVDIGITDTALDPERVEVEPGTIRFNIENNGDQTHELAVETANEVEESGEIGPGETGSLSVALPPGEYDIYDPRDNFRERGVEGVLVVRDNTDTVERTVTDEDTATVTQEDTDTVTREDTDTVTRTREDTDTVTRQETVTRQQTVPQQDQDQQTTTTP